MILQQPLALLNLAGELQDNRILTLPVLLQQRILLIEPFMRIESSRLSALSLLPTRCAASLMVISSPALPPDGNTAESSY